MNEAGLKITRLVVYAHDSEEVCSLVQIYAHWE